MLEIRELCLQAGSFQVARVNVSAAAGTCHALVGETGSGKTLVLETVAGLRRAKSGSIRWQERDITNLPPEARRLGYVPQDLALFPHMTVRQNIEYGLRLRQDDCAERYAELEKLTRALGIRHLLERSILNLSGGERQRIALARALAPGNTLLLLDEPFSALHEALRRELWLLLKSLQDQFAITILLVTHDMEEAYFLADSVSFIAGGKIVQSGDKQAVYRYPATVEAARFFGMQNLFAAEVIEASAASGDQLLVHCPDLNTTLRVRCVDAAKWSKRSRVVLGIRDKDIDVAAGPGGENPLLCKVIGCFAKRDGQILLVQPLSCGEPDASIKLELADLPSQQAAAWGVGQEIWLTLPAEKVFVFDAEASAD